MNELPKPYSRDELVFALAKSHSLLRHYAELLNIHDGGQRDIPEDVREWMNRVKADPTDYPTTPRIGGGE